jgi:crossover junction endodeoxyribonuclease RusA
MATAIRSICLELPYPPTVNTYYRHVGSKVLISAGGRAYRKAVAMALFLAGASQPMTGRLEVAVVLHPPDRRLRDIDNVLKSLLDAIQHGAGYLNDGQIDKLTIERAAPVPRGSAWVRITEIE